MAQKTSKPRAAVYTRISRDFTGEGAGVERQLEDCLWFCEERDYEFIEEYSDNSRSAFQDRKHRPRYERMLADFRAGKFDIIVVWRVDRLTRSTYGMVDMVRELEPLGLRLYADDLGEVDLSTVEGRNRAIDRAMRAEEESATKSKRQKRANLKRARQGRIKRGTRCFGYDGDFNVVAAEAEVVRAIYDAYVSGQTMSAITRAINGENPDLPDFPTSEPPNVIFARERKERRKRLNLPEPAPQLDDDGNPIPRKQLTTVWTMAVTQSILRNPRYAGYVYYNPVDKHGKCHPTNSNWSEYIVRDANGTPVDAVWPAIVDRDVWQRAQELRNKNLYRKDGTPISREGFPRKYFGAGVYRCAVCGKPMHSVSVGYRCDGHVNRSREKVDAYVLAAVRARLASPEFRDLAALARSNGFDEDGYAEKVAEARRKLERARQDYKDETIDGPMYREIREEQQAMLDALERERIASFADGTSEGVLAAPDPLAAFDALTEPAQISSVIKLLCTVYLHKHKQGTRVTPESLVKEVEIVWNGAERAQSSKQDVSKP